MKAKDILLDSDGDLLIENGDFKIGDSDAQHIKDILRAFPGWWKEFSSVGVGMAQYLNSSGKQQEIQRNIKLQLEADGYNQDLNVIANQLPEGTFNIITNATRG